MHFRVRAARASMAKLLLGSRKRPAPPVVLDPHRVDSDSDGRRVRPQDDIGIEELATEFEHVSVAPKRLRRQRRDAVRGSGENRGRPQRRGAAFVLVLPPRVHSNAHGTSTSCQPGSPGRSWMAAKISSRRVWNTTAPLLETTTPLALFHLSPWDMLWGTRGNEAASCPSSGLTSAAVRPSSG